MFCNMLPICLYPVYLLAIPLSVCLFYSNCHSFWPSARPLFLRLSIRLSVSMSVPLFVVKTLRPFVLLALFLSICLFGSSFVFLAVCLLSCCLSVRLFRMSVCPSIGSAFPSLSRLFSLCLSVGYLSVCPFVCLFLSFVYKMSRTKHHNVVVISGKNP